MSKIYNIDEIMKMLPHRYPFLLVDRLEVEEPGVKGVGLKNLTMNELFFQGHFPNNPIMPGVLLIESAAQLCSLVIAPESAASDENKLYVLLKVKDFKFLKPVIPGDTLQIAVNCVLASAAAYEFEAKISVDGVVKAKGSMLFTSMEKSAVYGE